MKTEDQIMTKLEKLTADLSELAKGFQTGVEVPMEKQIEAATTLSFISALYWAAGHEDLFALVFGGAMAAQGLKNLAPSQTSEPAPPVA